MYSAVGLHSNHQRMMRVLKKQTMPRKFPPNSCTQYPNFQNQFGSVILQFSKNRKLSQCTFILEMGISLRATFKSNSEVQSKGNYQEKNLWRACFGAEIAKLFFLTSKDLTNSNNNSLNLCITCLPASLGSLYLMFFASPISLLILKQCCSSIYLDFKHGKILLFP